MPEECECGGHVGGESRCRVCGGTVPEVSRKDQIETMRAKVAEGRARIEREIVRGEEPDDGE